MGQCGFKVLKMAKIERVYILLDYKTAAVLSSELGKYSLHLLRPSVEPDKKISRF